MATVPHVSLDEYLSTEYEPDCEYIDGVLVDRNAGIRKHSKTQGRLTVWLGARENEHGHDVLVEQRVRTGASRFRIPDICLVARGDSEEIINRPPALWIEILSPEDRWSRVQAKISDALAFGVGTIWIIDPYSSQAWIATQQAPVSEVTDGALRCTNPVLQVSLDQILPRD